MAFVNLYKKSGGPAVPLPSFDYTDDGYIRSNFEFDADIMTELHWVFDSTVEVADPPPLEPVPVPVPVFITAYQNYRQHIEQGDDFDWFIDYVKSTNNQPLIAYILSGNDIYRDSEHIEALRVFAGATNEQFDEFFTNAKRW